MQKLILVMLFLSLNPLSFEFKGEQHNALLTKLKAYEVLTNQKLKTGSSSIITVGADITCDYNLINEALDEANLTLMKPLKIFI